MMQSHRSQPTLVLMAALTATFLCSNAMAKTAKAPPTCPSGYTTLACPTQERLVEHFQKNLKLDHKEWKIIGIALHLQSTNVRFFHKKKGQPVMGDIICQYVGGLRLEIKSIDFGPTGCFLQCGKKHHISTPGTGASCDKSSAQLCCK